ncbi:pyruvate dehydrogenase [Chloropicon primus]|uniref:Acetyltransferase component of pyruvate dehydrogenase complex n=1 Tax=Chloropicon primus TaxID=1764295 RepID=A0A5B8MKQ6_9CHLO|nr:pyruvate dehydrogenase [Chloropicon primus]UPQ99846.1 pyruvate dehydrogenase [Chloropicon primus]|eukprot:QDZ20634.1 pyruvate dehydrogenase [Chloropicon primus]
MPSLSPTMSQGNIAGWKKAEGDQVAAGDVLAEVETDKATIEWESVEEGYLAKIFLQDGAKDVPVGTLVAVLCEEEGDVGKFESYSPAAASEQPAQEEEPSQSTSSPSSAAPSSLALALPPHTVLGMPSLSPTMTQGSLSSWSKKEGDAIEAGEILAEVETDKATIEWEAVDGGFLAKVLVQAGTSDIEIGRPVAIVCEEEEDMGAFKDVTPEMLANEGDQEAPSAPAPPQEAKKEKARPAAKAAAPMSSSSQAPRTHPSGHVLASPKARAMARDGNVDLSLVAGTGPGGRVIAADVAEYEESAPRQATHAGAAGDDNVPDAYEDVEVSQMRRVIAQRLLMSKQTIPHYYLTMDCEVGALMSLRSSVNASVAEKMGKVSLNDFVIKACALACQEVPECNAEWRDDAIRLHKNVHVGVAMDLGSLGHTQGGLVVPVVKNVQLKGVASISSVVKDYAARAKPADGVDGKMRLTPEEMDGGTFTVSNLGMMGVKQFAAIVNPPQSCILAVGGVRSEVKKDGPDGFREAKVMSVTLSCDHRVVDGAVGAKWLQKFKNLLENPLQMLLQ